MTKKSVPQATTHESDPLLTRQQAAAILNLQPATLARWPEDRLPPIRLNQRVVRYRRSDVQKLIDGQSAE